MANNLDLTSRLLGHAFGDGSIHGSKRYFIYTNATPELQTEVKDIVMRLFGKVSLNIATSIAGTPRYQYSNKVGYALCKRGAIAGSRVLQKTLLPEWICNGNDKVKASFLGALFDDDGYLRDSKNSKAIVLKATKIHYLEDNLRDYLNQIREMLEILGICASEIKFDQLKSRKDGCEMLSLRFWISGKENILRFKEQIPLSHPSKKVKFDNLFIGNHQVNGEGA